MSETAEILVRLCSHLCGQGRCFLVDGQALPVCQRCLGLYLGALATLAWLVASGTWRSGLPRARTFAIHVVALLAAGLGGLHAVDLGPGWRLACGLLTGHVVAYWLVGGIASLWRGQDACRLSRAATSRLADAQALALPAALVVLAAFYERLACVGWWPLSVATCLGIAALWGLSVTAVLLLLRPRRRSARVSGGFDNGSKSAAVSE